jgi:cell division protein FtsZ
MAAVVDRSVIALAILGLFDVVFGWSIPLQRYERWLSTAPSSTTFRSSLDRNRLHSLQAWGDSNENTDLDLSDPFHPSVDHVPCVIRVIGVGGGGGNAVNHMVQQKDDNLIGVSFYAINTDAQALSQSSVPNVMNIGRSLTRGLGAGGNPAIGEEAALENALELKRLLHGSDLVFITAGMGGGTGSGAAPVVAEIAKQECGCLTVGFVTKPFAFEGRRRMQQAEEAIAKLRSRVDTLIVVSNDKLLQMVPDDTPMTQAFAVADDILRQGVIGISDIILRTGLVNVDFADVRTVMKDAGAALLGIGVGRGKNRALDAAHAAITSPLLESPICQAKRVVFNICGGPDLGLSEVNAASEVIYKNCDPDAIIIFGALVDPSMGDTVSITVLACDFEGGVNAAPATIVSKTTAPLQPAPSVPSTEAKEDFPVRTEAVRDVNGAASSIAPEVIVPPSRDSPAPPLEPSRRPSINHDLFRRMLRE